MKTAIKLQRYGGDHGTGVIAYHIEKDGIIVLFQKGWYYLYDNEKPGATHVKAMKQLARQGAGLSTYISRYVHSTYKRKWRED